VLYATCIGTDPVSDEMLAFIAEAGHRHGRDRRVADLTIGLYMIAKAGERSFTYYPERLPAWHDARRFAGDPMSPWFSGFLAPAAGIEPATN
jgi:2-dehydro-3-deoxygluconokinase